jgi:hypothetical protein
MARDADLSHLRAVLGRAGCDQLIAAVGGTTVYVSVAGGGADWAALRLALGERAARRYAAEFGGQAVYIPRAARIDAARVRAAVRQRIAAGESTRRAVAAVARAEQISDRHVWSLISGAAVPPVENLDLFTHTQD